MTNTEKLEYERVLKEERDKWIDWAERAKKEMYIMGYNDAKNERIPLWIDQTEE